MGTGQGWPHMLLAESYTREVPVQEEGASSSVDVNEENMMYGADEDMGEQNVAPMEPSCVADEGGAL
uniref:Uncharacterized protein n=1 Tax=Arundo donax TaxID=35708 RepID=A0A0A8ZT58_ARUDO